MKLSYFCFALMFAFCSFCVCASDIGLVVLKGQGDESNNGGFLDLGLEVRYENSQWYGSPESSRVDNLKHNFTFEINANGRYQYNGFFVEIASASVSELNVGYKLYDTVNWSADFILSPILSYMGNGESDDWEGLEDRGGRLGAGLRLSYFTTDNVFQMRVLTERDDGYYASMFAGQNWQYRNWNFHALVGLELYNSQLMNHYYGVSEREAQINPDLWPYEVGKNITWTVDLGVTYPISERWVFRAYHRYVNLPSDIEKSPLVVRDRYQLLAASVSYVF